MTAARASVSACLMRGSVSFASAASSAGSALCSRDLNTACAASKRLAGIGASRLKPPSAASSARRTRLLTRTSARSAGSAPVRRRAGRGVDQLAGLVLVEDLLLLGAVGQPAVLQRLDDGDGARIAGRRDLGDAGVGLGEIVLEEMRQRAGKTGQRGSAGSGLRPVQPAGAGSAAGAGCAATGAAGAVNARPKRKESRPDGLARRASQCFPGGLSGEAAVNPPPPDFEQMSAQARRQRQAPPHLLVLTL